MKSRWQLQQRDRLVTSTLHQFLPSFPLYYVPIAGQKQDLSQLGRNSGKRGFISINSRHLYLKRQQMNFAFVLGQASRFSSIRRPKLVFQFRHRALSSQCAVRFVRAGFSSRSSSEKASRFSSTPSLTTRLGAHEQVRERPDPQRSLRGLGGQTESMRSHS